MKNLFKAFALTASLIVAIGLKSFGQGQKPKFVPIAYYDAISLENYQKISTGLLDTILASYSSKSGNNGPKTIDTMIQRNPFFSKSLKMGLRNKIDPYLDSLLKDTTKGQYGGGNIIAGSISALGNLNITNIANGVAGFLVKRAKQELLIAVINKLKNSTKFPEIPILFPNTYNLMKSFNSWEFSNALNTIKAAFDKDLQQLLGDIPKLNTLSTDTSKNPAYNSYNNAAKKRVTAIYKFFQTPDARIFISALQIGNGVITGQKIPDVIHTIASPGYLSDIPNANPIVHNSVRLLDILSYSVRSKGSDTSYISGNQFKTLLGDDELRTIFFGLLYQQIANEDIKFDTTKVANLITPNSYKGASNYLHEVIAQGESLNTAVANLISGKKKGEKDLSSYWAGAFESAKDLLKASSNISEINSSLKFPPQIQKAIDDAAQTLAVANDIAVKNYSAAIVDFSNFIPDDQQKNTSKKKGTAKKNGAARQTGTGSQNSVVPQSSDASQAAVAPQGGNTPQTVDTTQKNTGFKKFFVKYGSFAANLAQAQNADDAENAIEAVALPVGSYSVKQNSTWNISLNGYIGYAKDANYASGIYAPIGFSLSTATFFTHCDCTVPLTLFVPIFDVGSIAHYQLDNPNTTATSTTGTATTSGTVNTSASNQQIKFGSIFAPGVELFYEIPTLPFAVGLGQRRTPTLSYSSGSTYSTVGARWQWNFTILIDIPIFTLLNRGKD